MKVGKLRERVALQSATKTRDGVGGWTSTWSTYATVWAEVKAQDGRERENAQRVEALRTYTVTIRRRTDLLAEHRISWRGRVLNIRAIPDEGPHSAYLVLQAEMGVKT